MRKNVIFLIQITILGVFSCGLYGSELISCASTRLVPIQLNPNAKAFVPAKLKTLDRLVEDSFDTTEHSAFNMSECSSDKDLSDEEYSFDCVNAVSAGMDIQQKQAEQKVFFEKVGPSTATVFVQPALMMVSGVSMKKIAPFFDAQGQKLGYTVDDFLMSVVSMQPPMLIVQNANSVTNDVKDSEELLSSEESESKSYVSRNLVEECQKYLKQNQGIKEKNADKLRNEVSAIFTEFKKENTKPSAIVQARIPVRVGLPVKDINELYAKYAPHLLVSK